MKNLTTSIIAITLATIGVGAGFYAYINAIKVDSGDSQLIFNYYQLPAVMPELNFVDGKNRELSLESFHDKVVLLNIWATWCVPCRQEMPALDRLQAMLGGTDFEVVALSIDRGQIDIIEDFYEELELSSLAIYQDSTGGAPYKLNVRGIPATLLINRQGNELGRVVGPAEWDSPEIVIEIRSHLPTD
jgi:thiol-disulfide isomerase/thioredoxin